MNHIERLKVSAVVTTTVVGIGVIFDMVSPIDIGDTLFSPMFVVPVFIVAFMLSPMIGRFIKYK